MYKSLTAAQRDVMINCMLLANHEGKSWEWKGELFKCEPGQFVTSLEKLKKVCADDVTYQNARTAIKKLEKWCFLTNESTKTGRLITIVNWGKYQDRDIETNKDANRQLTDSQQTANRQLTTNKNDIRTIKNDKEYIVSNPEKIYASLSGDWKPLFQDYIKIYQSKNKTGKIADNRHYRLLNELYNIFRAMSFKFDNQEYKLTKDIFSDGVNTLIDKNIDNLNYAKKVWISAIEKGEQPQNTKNRKAGYNREEAKKFKSDEYR